MTSREDPPKGRAGGRPQAFGAQALPAAPDSAASDADADLMADWLALLQQNRIDWTNGHRALCAAAAGDDAPLRDQFVDREALSAWLARWRVRIGATLGPDAAASTHRASVDIANPEATGALPAEGRGAGDQALPSHGRGLATAAALRRANPAYIPRNHAVEAMIAAATEGDMAPFERLQRALAKPFDEQPDCADLARPAPTDAGPYRTFCGT